MFKIRWFKTQQIKLFGTFKTVIYHSKNDLNYDKYSKNCDSVYNYPGIIETKSVVTYNGEDYKVTKKR